MRNSLLLSAGIFALVACTKAPEAPQAQVSEAQATTAVAGTELAIDTTKSQVKWIGTKVTGRHEGTFAVTGGKFIVNDSALVGGEFTLSIARLNVTDLEGEWKQKLTGHLLSADFLDAQNHPEAKFVITEVKAQAGANGATHLVKGNLTLRGVTKAIEIPATVTRSGNEIAVAANFNINRKDFGIAYEGKKDDLIRDEVNLNIDVKTPVAAAATAAPATK